MNLSTGTIVAVGVVLGASAIISGVSGDPLLLVRGGFVALILGLIGWGVVVTRRKAGRLKGQLGELGLTEVAGDARDQFTTFKGGAGEVPMVVKLGKDGSALLRFGMPAGMLAAGTWLASVHGNLDQNACVVDGGWTSGRADAVVLHGPGED